MTKELNAERKLQLHVDLNAPMEVVWKALTEAEGLANWFAPMVKVSSPGPGGEVTAAWSDEMVLMARVDVWEPNQRVRWINDTGMMGPGTLIVTDFHLEAASGKIRVRLVQSGFGERGLGRFLRGNRARLDLLPLQPAPVRREAYRTQAPHARRTRRSEGTTGHGLEAHRGGDDRCRTGPCECDQSG